MTPALRIIFSKLDDRRHRFEYRRADGSSEARVMETRSLLLHDLAHFALESTAGIADGFYGRLAAGETIDDLAAPEGGYAGETLALEQRVVTLQMAARRGDEAPPAMADAHAELTRLLGRWKATPHGGAMELRFQADQG